MFYTFLIISLSLSLGPFMAIISPPQLYSCYETWEGQATRVAAGKDCFKAKKVLSLGDYGYELFSGGKETTGKL